MKRTLGIVFAAAVAGAFAGGLIGVLLDGGSDEATAPAAAATTPSIGSPPAAGRGFTGEQIYSRDAPGVVVITDTQTQVVPPTFFTPGGTQKVGALGSGFVIDKQGDIVTNDHVVQGASSIRVGFNGGVSYPARIVGADPSSDLAVIRVEAPVAALHPLTFDDASAIRVGDPVYAIGNPFGLDRTMTAGIVSATRRDIQSPNGRTIPNAIQTDAPINHGNSGGPLLDARGRVIGVNAQIQGGTVDANVGIGFAISGRTAGSVARQLIAGGRSSIRGWASRSRRSIPTWPRSCAASRRRESSLPASSRESRREGRARRRHSSGDGRRRQRPRRRRHDHRPRRQERHVVGAACRRRGAPEARRQGDARGRTGRRKRTVHVTLANTPDNS